MLILIVPLAVLLVLYIWRRRRLSLFKRIWIPGPEPSIIWGNILEIKAKGSASTFSDWTKKYGDIVGFYNGAVPFLLVKDLELLKKVLVQEWRVFPDRGELFGVLPAPVNPNALVFTATSERWNAMRRTVSPAFTTSKLNKIFPILEAGSKTLAEIIGSDGEGRSTNIMHLLRRYSLDVVLKAGFGADMDIQKATQGSIFERLIEKSLPLLQSMGLHGITLASNCLPELHLLFKWLVSAASVFTDAFVDVLLTVVRPIIERRRKSYSGQQCDVLQLLLNQEACINDKGEPTRGVLSRTEVLYNACAYVFAGLDSISHAVAAALYLLAVHQDAQQRLRKEISAASDENGKLDYRTVGQIKYLDMVIKESMRIYYHNVAFVTRRAAFDFEYKSIKIPKGLNVMAASSCLNQDPSIWRNPTVFDPERFSEENKRCIDPISFMPFGHGPHACIGRAFGLLSVKVALATILSRFRVHVGEEHQADLVKLRSGFLTAWLATSMWLKFEDI